MSFGVPGKSTDGASITLHTRVCLPSSATTAATVVILNHGSPPSASDRATVDGYKCDSEPAQWFLTRGYIVASPVRRGYGATGGPWAESYGKCENADFHRAGVETARDILAVVEFVDKIPRARKDQVVVVGQSAGGWGSIALNSLPHPKVKAIINMAGGRGGHYGPNENQNCAPALLAQTVGRFGATATTPMLWIYAENDSFFAPPLAKSLYEAFIKSGGKAIFIQMPPFGADGHRQFAAPGGSKIWGPDVQKYMDVNLSR